MYDPSSPLLRSGSSPPGLPQPEAKTRFAEDRLLDAVLWCEVLPGETVTESDVMDRFGLTRAAARMALMRLGYDGWAVPQARMGWQVAPVTGALIGQVLAARRLLEPTALATSALSQDKIEEINQIGAILGALELQPDASATISFRHFVDQIDSLLLTGIDEFTARHLRKLWHHSARISRYLENQANGHIFRRDDIFALVQAVVARAPEEIAAARCRLIDAQESFFLAQILKSDAALGPGSGLNDRIREAANNRRPK